MKNRYFNGMRNRKLDRGKLNLNKKRNKGASLVYVLVILSIISAFSINFVYYVHQKKEMVFLKSQKENQFEKKFLIQKENQNVKKIMDNGIYFNENLVTLEKKEQYFDSRLENDGQEIKMEKLIFLKKDSESIGNYMVKSIKDSNENEYFLPLEENKVYGELKVVFARKILDKEILFQEKIEFRRINPMEVEMKVLESQFL